VRTSCCALRPYLRPEELRRLLADVFALPRAVVLRRLAAVLRRRAAVLRERVLRARVLRARDPVERLRAELVRRRELAERERVDVERLRGERRDDARALVPRLRPRVDVFLVAIPSHSPCECQRTVMRAHCLENEIVRVHIGLCISFSDSFRLLFLDVAVMVVTTRAEHSSSTRVSLQGRFVSSGRRMLVA
jgi:hypothetical protein